MINISFQLDTTHGPLPSTDQHFHLLPPKGAQQEKRKLDEEEEEEFEKRNNKKERMEVSQ